MNINRAKVLIADDDQPIRYLLTTILEREGYEVLSVANGNDAVQTAQTEQFDLVIADLRMPGLDGMEVLKAIKREVYQDTEVVIMTGHASLDTATEAVRNGAYDYIQKPFSSIEDVANIAKRAIEKHRLTVENKKKLFELEVLYNVSNTISYTLDHQELLQIIMDSLNKVIDCDLCTSLHVASGQKTHLTIRSSRLVAPSLVTEAKANIIQAFNTLAGNPIQEEQLSILEEVDLSDTSDTDAQSIQSFFNVPLIIRERPVGMINISSTKEDAFSQYDIRLLYTIANQASIAIDRLRAVVAAEKSKMETMVESMSDGVIMMDNKGDVVVINPAAQNMLGVAGIDQPKIIEELGLPGFLEMNLDKTGTSHLAEDEELIKEIVITEPQKTILQASISPVKNIDGQELGIVTVLRDVTREKEIDRMKSDFISIVSHELRAPLANIKNAVSIVEIAGEVNEDQQEFLSIAMEDIDRLSRLISQLLDISRIESGRMELDFESINVGSVAAASITSLERRADEKNIAIINKIPDDLPQLSADKDRLTQIFTILIDNALKFADEGGKITVDAKYTPGGQVSVGATVATKSLNSLDVMEISVSDTGIGIASKDLDKVFNRFQQLSSSSTRKEGGTGLGLAIAKEIIEKHHGKIWVESQIGKGSTFTFILPMTQNGKEDV